MLAAKVLTGKPAFMANPSMINARTNEIILAHCTIGIAQTEQFIIRNHFETESGIGIQGILPTGDVTIVKCGGECLDEYYLGTGTLTENTNYINMCRTQVRIKMNAPGGIFPEKSVGQPSHHAAWQLRTDARRVPAIQRMQKDRINSKTDRQSYYIITHADFKAGSSARL